MAADILDPYTVRCMRKEEIHQVMDIWKETGLAEGTHTVATWYEVDPQGFFVAATERGEIYGTCAAVILNEDLAFLGLYAVRSRYQRRGIGIKVWKKAMEHVRGRNAGLNSVPEHLHTYRDLAGFSVVTNWQTVVCESQTLDISSLVEEVTDIGVHLIDDILLPGVIEYDHSVHGYSRSRIVSLSIVELDCLSMAAVQGDGKVCGYGSIKKNIQGPSLVGPLYADCQDIAELLLRKLVSSSDHAQKYGLTMMIVDCNKEAVDLVNKLELKMSTKVPRCYLKKEIEAVFSKIFGQHALNFSTF